MLKRIHGLSKPQPGDGAGGLQYVPDRRVSGREQPVLGGRYTFIKLSPNRHPRTTFWAVPRCLDVFSPFKGGPVATCGALTLAQG